MVIVDELGAPKTTAAAPAPGEARRRIWSIVAGSTGNLVEWYDFYVYAFTALYFAPAFFPKGDQTAQLLNTAGVFAAGFLMRPIGGWFFGRYADRHGRKAAMLLSVLMMCGGSLLVACLPTYAAIGAVAPLGLLAARLAQGFSVGGEYGTSATYLSEVATSGRRGFLASFQYVTLIGGQLTASLALFGLQQVLSEGELRAWGWRIPFVLGALLALSALFLRRTLQETAPAAERHELAGTMRALARHWRAVAVVLGLTAGGSLSFYTFTTYMQKYLVNTAHMSPRTATGVMTWVLFAYMLMQPLFGLLSDRIGRRACLIAFGALSALLTVPLLTALAGVQNPVAAFALVLAALAIASLYTSISGLFKAELFPIEVRALGVGLSYAVANALFGGSAEYVALWFKQAGHEPWFYWYVTAMSAVALATALSMRDLKRHGTLDQRP
ncbi:MAG TPA: MFS family transporter [Caulobacteraceae bacterium]|jgi:MHS family alpha-ketoglutarate permease-like MFS transporter|nr:MFS family transporter [Caulobacteraceae bacterium]